MAGTIQTEGENVELGTEREVLEQSKLQSKTISAPSDFYVSHDYGKIGEIPQGSMSFQSMESGKQKGLLTFEQKMELLRFEREMALEREAIEERSEERRRRGRMEEKAFELELERERAKDQMCLGKRRVRKLVEGREMRENEDIGDYFRIFEMTARAQLFPQEEWLGSLVPRLSEKAKSIYLEIVGPDAQNYGKSKATILSAYQLNVDHYRYRFRHSEKYAGEDFCQWAHRTRRYLNRWMMVANANNDSEKF